MPTSGSRNERGRRSDAHRAGQAVAFRVAGETVVGAQAIPRRADDGRADQPAGGRHADRDARHARQLGSHDGTDVHLVADDHIGPLALDLRVQRTCPERAELGDEVLPDDRPLQLTVDGHQRRPVAVQRVGPHDDRLEAERGEARHDRLLPGERDRMTEGSRQPGDREQRLGVPPSADEGCQDAHALPAGFEPARCGLEGRCSVLTELREPESRSLRITSAARRV